MTDTKNYDEIKAVEIQRLQAFYIESVKATLDSGTHAIRGTFIINGGSAIALLALLGSISGKQGVSSVNILPVFSYPLTLFAGGACIAVIASCIKYLGQAAYTKETQQYLSDAIKAGPTDTSQDLSDTLQPKPKETDIQQVQLKQKIINIFKRFWKWWNGDKLNYLTISLVFLSFIFFAAGGYYTHSSLNNYQEAKINKEKKTNNFANCITLLRPSTFQ